MSNDEYQQQNYFNNNEPFQIVLTEYVYDHMLKKYGSNCGFDPHRIKVIRGYPKFNDNGK